MVEFIYNYGMSEIRPAFLDRTQVQKPWKEEKIDTFDSIKNIFKFLYGKDVLNSWGICTGQEDDEKPSIQPTNCKRVENGQNFPFSPLFFHLIHKIISPQLGSWSYSHFKFSVHRFVFLLSFLPPHYFPLHSGSWICKKWGICGGIVGKE